MGGQCRQHGCVGQSHDSSPDWNGTECYKFLLRCSEECTIKYYKLSTSGTFHLTFSDHSWPWVIEIVGIKTMYCCAGWGYIVAFTKALTMYQIYHTWIHLLHHSPLSSLPHSWNSFNRSYFSIYVHVYTVFAPYSPSLSLPSPPSHWYQPPPPPSRSYSVLLSSNFTKDKHNDSFVYLR
jgi:hypothetical protein